jgi:hypothetical protein
VNAFEQNTSVDHAAAKIVSVAGATLFGLSVSEWAALAALIYSLLLIGEFVWKKFIRPYCEHRGWIKRTFKRRSDYYDER